MARKRGRRRSRGAVQRGWAVAWRELGPKPKLTAHQKREAIKRRDAGEPVREIAPSYNDRTIPRLAA